MASRCWRSSARPCAFGAPGNFALPVSREPVDDQIVVDLRRLAAEHEINLERLIDEARVVDVLLDLLLERQNEPGTQQPFEGLAVEIVRRVLEAGALAQAEGLFDRRGIVPLGVADRKVGSEPINS